MYIRSDEKIGLIAARNFQAASIFNSHGIDFYCSGERTLEHACLEDNVPISPILDDLWDLNEQRLNAPDFEEMDVNELSVYIVRNHHKFTERKLVFIKNTLDRLIRERVVSKHKIEAIMETFEDLSGYLTVHLKYEEFVIFPIIQKLIKTKSLKFLKSGRLEHPIAAMKDDHRYAVAVLKKLALLTDNFVAPDNKDRGLNLTYAAMKELDDDLKIHMHLENNILFPRAISVANSIGDHSTKPRMVFLETSER